MVIWQVLVGGHTLSREEELIVIKLTINGRFTNSRWIWYSSLFPGCCPWEPIPFLSCLVTWTCFTTRSDSDWVTLTHQGSLIMQIKQQFIHLLVDQKVSATHRTTTFRRPIASWSNSSGATRIWQWGISLVAPSPRPCRWNSPSILSGSGTVRSHSVFPLRSASWCGLWTGSAIDTFFCGCAIHRVIQLMLLPFLRTSSGHSFTAITFLAGWTFTSALSVRVENEGIAAVVVVVWKCKWNILFD